MKKSNIINLIRYYSEQNDQDFKNEAYEIAKDFDRSGDSQLAEYILALLSHANTFVPQINDDNDDLMFIKKIDTKSDILPIPEVIKTDVIGIINSVINKLGVNKFLFQGSPGTGKTETVKNIARILDRELFIVNFPTLIDSKLGETGKNIAKLFKEINNLKQPEKAVILFDEIDWLAMDRMNNNDIREMGRATTAVFKGLEELNENILLIATTNLFNHFDRALTRRFDAVIDFNRYSNDDLFEISEILLDHFLTKFKKFSKNIRLFRKVLSLMQNIPYPGELKNLIKTSLAFSNPEIEFDYLKKLYNKVIGGNTMDLKLLKEKGFTVREIEILTGVSKSQVSRELQE